MLIKSVLVVGRPLFAMARTATRRNAHAVMIPVHPSPPPVSLHCTSVVAKPQSTHCMIVLVPCLSPCAPYELQSDVRSQLFICTQAAACKPWIESAAAPRRPPLAWLAPPAHPFMQGAHGKPLQRTAPCSAWISDGTSAEQQRQAADDARAAPPHQPRAGRRDHHAGGQADVRSRPAAPGRGRRALLAPLTPPCALPAPCRWPFAVGFAVSSYIFIKVAASVTGERLQPAAPPPLHWPTLLPLGLPPALRALASSAHSHAGCGSCSRAVKLLVGVLLPPLSLRYGEAPRVAVPRCRPQTRM